MENRSRLFHVFAAGYWLTHFFFFLTRSTKNAMYNKNELNSRHMNFVNKIIIINITNKKAKVSKVIDIAQALPYF